MLLLLIPVLASLSPQASAPAAERVLELGHPTALRVVGTEAIPAPTIREALIHDRDYYETSHPARALDQYRAWLVAATTAGYLHAGFTDARVEVHIDRELGSVTVEIIEGRQLLALEVELEGALLLDPEWLRAVLEAGTVQLIARDHLPVPPAPVHLEPILRMDAGSLMPPRFWVPGRPAPLAPSDRERLEQLADEAAQAAGLTQARLSVRWDIGPEGIRPVVVIEDEGPVSLIEQVRLEGNFTDPGDVLIRWVAIPTGTPANEVVRQAAAERLLASGRFGSVVARYSPVAGDAAATDLILHIEQAPTIPDLIDHPTQAMTLLRRMALRLEERATTSVGLDLAVVFSPEASRKALDAAASAGLLLTRAEGDRLRLNFTQVRGSAALLLVQATRDGQETTLAGLQLSERGGWLQCPPLGLGFDLPAFDGQVLSDIRASYMTPTEADGRAFNLELSGGIHTRGAGAENAPLLLQSAVSPSALLYLLDLGEAPSEPSSDQLIRAFEFEIGHMTVSIGRADARLSLVGEFTTELMNVNLRFGEWDDHEPAAMSSIELRPTNTGVGGSISGMTAMRALRSELGLGDSAAGPELALILSGLRALVDDAWRRRDAAAIDADSPEFIIPRAAAPIEPMAMFRAYAEFLATTLIEHQAPGSWPAELARAAPFVVLPENREELTFVASRGLVAVARATDRGPLGAWLAAELCTLGGHAQQASRFAALAREDLSSGAFLRDCGTLLALDSGASPVARAWRELYASATSDAGALSDTHTAMLRETFSGVGGDTSDGAWLRAGLARLWQTRLRELLLARLDTIEAGGREGK